MMRLYVAVVAGVLAVLALAVAVQQRSVAAHWRDLEHERAAAVAGQLQKQDAELVALRKTRTDLQGRLDALAHSKAAAGDQSDELTVLADRGETVQVQLSACAAGGTPTDSTCEQAAFDAEQILAAMTRVAHP